MSGAEIGCEFLHEAVDLLRLARQPEQQFKENLEQFKEQLEQFKEQFMTVCDSDWDELGFQFIL